MELCCIRRDGGRGFPMQEDCPMITQHPEIRRKMLHSLTRLDVDASRGCNYRSQRPPICAAGISTVSGLSYCTRSFSIRSLQIAIFDIFLVLYYPMGQATGLFGRSSVHPFRDPSSFATFPAPWQARETLLHMLKQCGPFPHPSPLGEE